MFQLQGGSDLSVTCWEAESESD